MLSEENLFLLIDNYQRQKQEIVVFSVDVFRFCASRAHSSPAKARDGSDSSGRSARSRSRGRAAAQRGENQINSRPR